MFSSTENATKAKPGTYPADGYDGVSYYCNGAVSGAWWFGNYQHTAAGYAPVDLYDDGTVQNGYVAYQ